MIFPIDISIHNNAKEFFTVAGLNVFIADIYTRCCFSTLNFILYVRFFLDVFNIVNLKLHLTQHCGYTVFRLTGVCVSNHNNNTFVIICISIGDRLFGNLGSYFGFCWCQLEIPGDCQKRSLHAKSTFQSHIQHPSWDLLTFFASLYSEKNE